MNLGPIMRNRSALKEIPKPAYGGYSEFHALLRDVAGTETTVPPIRSHN